MIQKFEIGDIVVLKSGGPVMTVHAIGDYSESAKINPGILCVWFDGAKKSQEVFHPNAIEIYKAMTISGSATGSKFDPYAEST